jgi:hypothetical protein
VPLIEPGKVNAEGRMTGKVMVVEFVLPTAFAVALGLVLSIAATYLTECRLGAVLDLVSL